jgi:hypothetical protein
MHIFVCTAVLGPALESELPREPVFDEEFANCSSITIKSLPILKTQNGLAYKA